VSNRLLSVLERFLGQTVLVVGDVMLDRYWWGTVGRTSPEAPVPVVQKKRVTSMPGGAANVAANIVGLGGRALLVGLVGDDEAGRDLMAGLGGSGVSAEHLVTSPERPTTTKLRVVAHNQHVVRVDEESTAEATAAEAVLLVDRVQAVLRGAGAVVISDYAKGVLGRQVLGPVIDAARRCGVPVLVDPKGTDYRRYDGATLLAPNRIEASIAAAVTADGPQAVEVAGCALLEQVRIDALIVTEGEAGMTILERGRAPVKLLAQPRVVYDVTGAGDSVMAVLSLGLAVSADLTTAGQLANLAGGLAVEQAHTAVVTLDQLQRDAKARP